MKNLKKLAKSVLSICLLFSSSYLLGASITSTEITATENAKIFVLSIETSGIGSIDVSIENAKGNQVVSDHYESMSSFSKRMNLEALPNGDYSLIIEDEFFRNVRELKIQNGKLSVDPFKVEVFKKAQMVWDNANRKLKVNWLMNDYNESKLTILDKNSKQVFRHKFPESLVLNKRFCLERLDPGSYTVIIKNKNASYTETFNIK